MAELSVVVDRLGEIFTSCDRNGDGVVNKRELILACRSQPDVAAFWGVSSQIRQEDGSRDTLERKFQEIDGNDDRAISWTEFLNFHLQYAQQKAAEEAVVVRSLTDGGQSETSSKGTGSGQVPAPVSSNLPVGQQCQSQGMYTSAIRAAPPRLQTSGGTSSVASHHYRLQSGSIAGGAVPVSPSMMSIPGTARIMATPHALTSAGVSSSTSAPGMNGPYVLQGTAPAAQTTSLQPIVSIRSMGQVPSSGVAGQSAPAAAADLRSLQLPASRIIPQSSVTIASQGAVQLEENGIPMSSQFFNREPVAGEGFPRPAPPTTSAPTSWTAAPTVSQPVPAKKSEEEDSDSGSDSDSDDDECSPTASPDSNRQGTIKSLARGFRDFMEDVRDGWEELVRYRPEYDRSASSPSQQPSHPHQQHHPPHEPSPEARRDLLKIHDEKYKLEKQQKLLEEHLLHQQSLLDKQQQQQQQQYEQQQQQQWEQHQLLYQQQQLQQSLEMHLAAVGHIPQSGGMTAATMPTVQPYSGMAPVPMWDPNIPATLPAVPVGSQWVSAATVSSPTASPFGPAATGFPGGPGLAPTQTPPVPIPTEPLFEGWASHGGASPVQMPHQGSPTAVPQQALPPSATMGTCAAFGQAPQATLGFGPGMAAVAMPSSAVSMPMSMPMPTAAASAPAAMPTTPLQFGGSPTSQHQPWSGDSYVNVY